MQIYLVGGAIRDALLNRPVKERDWVVVGGTREQMLSQGYREVGKDFPVFIHPETGEEYALARTERKTAPGYTGFQCYFAPDVTLEEDLRRRDLTVNAMAQDAHGVIIDPFNGQQDLVNKKLRHVSQAFVEDPLRVLRVARFAARYAHLGFVVADETVTLMRQVVELGEMSHLVAERVWKELATVLREVTPSQFFHVLRACSANRILFPEIDALFGVPAEKKWHPEIDTGLHTMMVIDQAAAGHCSVEACFAALVHDVGKGITDPKEWPKHREHEKNGIPLVQSFCDRLKVPRSCRELAMLVTRYHGECHRALELDADALVSFLEACDAFRRAARFELFLSACEADSRGRLNYEHSEYTQASLCRRALQAAGCVSVESILQNGVHGEGIAKELHRLRVIEVQKMT